MFLPLGSGQVNRARMGGRGGRPAAPPRKKKQKVSATTGAETESDATLVHEGLGSPVVGDSMNVEGLELFEDLATTKKGKKRGVSFDLGNGQLVSAGVPEESTVSSRSAEEEDRERNLDLLSNSHSASSGRHTSERNDNTEEKTQTRARAPSIGSLNLLPTSPQQEVIHPSFQSRSRSGSITHNGVPLLSMPPPRVRSNSSVSMSSSLGTRARSGSVSSRSKAIPTARPRTSSITSSVLAPLSSLISSSSTSSSSGSFLAGLLHPPQHSSTSSANASSSSPSTSSTAVTLGGEKNVGQLRMRDFLRNRKDGKQAASGIKRRESMKQKRIEEKRLKKLGIEAPKKAPKPPPRPQKSIFDEEENDSTPLAPQVIIKDGKVIVDSTSLVYKPQRAEMPEIPVQDDEDRPRVTSMSFVKRSTVSRWTEQETKIFYMALRQCGQNFEMIAQYFPSRDRRQIARKYKREEADHPDILERALNPRAAMPFQVSEIVDPTLANQFKILDQFHKDLGQEPARNLEDAISSISSLPIATQNPSGFDIPSPPKKAGKKNGTTSTEEEKDGDAPLTLEQLIEQKAKEAAERAQNPSATNEEQTADLDGEVGEIEEEEEDDDDDEEEEGLKSRYLHDDDDGYAYSSGEEM